MEEYAKYQEHFGLIGSVCKSFIKPSERGVMPIEDTEAFSVACVAFARAVKKFNPEIGTFATFARSCMYRELCRHAVSSRLSIQTWSIFNSSGNVSPDDEPSYTDDLQGDLELAESLDCMYDAIKRLRPNQRNVMLRRLRGETMREIAEAMGVTFQRVAQISDAAIERLIEILRVEETTNDE